MTQPLKLWFLKNRTHPYPSRAEKTLLAEQCGLRFSQVNNWFCNARRRLKAGEQNLFQQDELAQSKPTKYKHSILHRYLNDTLQYGHTRSHYPDELSSSLIQNTRHRQNSTSSNEQEENNNTSLLHNQQSLLDHTSHENEKEVEDLRQDTHTPLSVLDMELPQNRYLDDREMSAVRALTYLALGHK